jgi:hypothetical protein
VFRRGVRDAVAQIEPRCWMHAFAVAHVDGLGGASLIGIKRHDLGLNGFEDLGEALRLSGPRRAAATSIGLIQRDG